MCSTPGPPSHSATSLWQVASTFLNWARLHLWSCPSFSIVYSPLAPSFWGAFYFKINFQAFVMQFSNRYKAGETKTGTPTHPPGAHHPASIISSRRPVSVHLYYIYPTSSMRSFGNKFQVSDNFIHRHFSTVSLKYRVLTEPYLVILLLLKLLAMIP